MMIKYIFYITFLLAMTYGCRKDQYDLKPNIVVHPTTFDTSINVDLINLKDSIKININNKYGQDVYHQKHLISNHHFEQINIILNSLSPDVYFCFVSTNDTTYSQKIIKN